MVERDMAASDATSDERRRARPFERVALVLQGGGALGAYQVGVFEALDEAGLCPQWFAGTSIGAINGAIMAGNAPGERAAKLDEFWQRISRPDGWLADPIHDEGRKLANQWHAWETVLYGQPGFFRPRMFGPFASPPGTPGAISFYDTGPLAESLRGAIDFGRVNNGGPRLSLGAVNLATGRQIYFDSARQAIDERHVMASGALPPGFPPVEIDRELFWDGGVVSNTPLEVVLDDEPRVSTLCFMVDVWDPMGPPPRTLDDVTEREKDIRYASRSERAIASYRRSHNLRRAVMALWSRLPAEARADPALEQLAWMGCTTTMRIVHLIYQNPKYATASKDYEFSRASIAEHRAAGRRDARRAIDESRWEEPVPPHLGVAVYEYPPRNVEF
jgi:NTE family protein